MRRKIVATALNFLFFSVPSPMFSGRAKGNNSFPGERYDVLELREFIRAVLEKHPDVAYAKAVAAEARAARLAALSAYLPSVVTTASTDRNSLYEEQERQLTFGVEQRVFDLDSIFRTRSSEHSLAAARLRVGAEKTRVRFLLASIYMKALSLLSDYAATKKYVQVLKLRREIAGRAREIGKDSKVAFTLSDSAWISAEARLKALGSAVDEVATIMTELTGRAVILDPRSEDAFTTKLIIPEALFLVPSAVDVGGSLRRVMRLVEKNNSSLKAAKERVKATRAELERAKLRHIPSVGGFYNYSYYDRGSVDPQKVHTFGLRASIAFSGESAAAIVQAERAVARAEAELEQLRWQLKERALSAIRELISADTEASTLSVVHKNSKVRYLSAKKAFKTGIYSLSRFVEEEYQFAQSKADLIKAVARRVLAEEQLISVTDLMNPNVIGSTLLRKEKGGK